MSQAFWEKLKKLPKFLETAQVEPGELADRIRRTGCFEVLTGNQTRYHA